MIGSCKEGLGEHVFEEWMTKSPSAESMIPRIRRTSSWEDTRPLRLPWYWKMQRFILYPIWKMILCGIFLEPKASAQEALDCAFEKLGKDAKVLAMPYGGSHSPFAAGRINNKIGAYTIMDYAKES